MQRCQLASQRIITRIIRRDKGKEDARQQLISLFFLFFILCRCSAHVEAAESHLSFIIEQVDCYCWASGCLLHLFPFLIFA